MNTFEKIRNICSEISNCSNCDFSRWGNCPFQRVPANWTDKQVESYNAIVDKTEGTEDDSVNHPSHYCQDGSMECIDEMAEVFGVEAVKSFCICNVWKYRKRAMFKNGKEDLAKSDWYMKKFVELKESEADGRE